MPPVTPTSTRATGASLPLVLVLDLALGNLFEGDREVVLRAGLHERRREVLEGAFAELVVVVVDLAGALRRNEHEAVAVGNVGQQVVYARMDHSSDIVATSQCFPTS